MNRKGFAPIIILLLIAGTLIVGGIYYYATNRVASPQTQNHASVSTTAPSSLPVTLPTSVTTTTSQAKNPAVVVPVQTFVSSSTAQVGDFAVVANCGAVSAALSESGIASVSRIDILKGGSVVQSISTRGIAVPSRSCPKPESQDINFDGYPDFMIPADAGSGGTSYYYWLFDTSTQQFACPGGNYFYCALMNPTFNSASKTISEWDTLGASDSVFQVYKANGDNLILYQETDITSSGTTTTKTVKQLENGQMQVVSTSTSTP